MMVTPRFAGLHPIKLTYYNGEGKEAAAELKARGEILRDLGMKTLGHGKFEGQDIYVGIVPNKKGRLYPEMLIATGEGKTAADAKIQGIITRALSGMLGVDPEALADLPLIYKFNDFSSSGKFEQKGDKTVVDYGFTTYNFGKTHDDGKLGSGIGV